MEKRWFPLESNPSVMNKYCKGLGLNTSIYAFQDVLSVEDWALNMIPNPVLGILFLYPIKALSQHSGEENKSIETSEPFVSPKVYFMKQTVGNACGTVALLHALCNAFDEVIIEPNSFLEKFYIDTLSMTSDERATYLAESSAIEASHIVAASTGQSEQNMNVNTHFIALSVVEGFLYELDGRKKYPINHGGSSRETFLSDACKVIRQFMDRDPNEMRFTVIALAPSVEFI